MHPITHFNAALVLGLCTVAAAQAATYGVRSSARIAAPPEFNSQDTGWLANAPSLPAIAGAAVAGSSFDTKSWAGQMQVVTTYGDLRATGWATVTNDVNNGAFQHHGPGTPVGGEPNGWFADRLTVRSDTLPLGTVVTITVDLDFLGSFSNSFDRPNGNWVDLTGGVVVEPVHPYNTWLMVGKSTTRALDTQKQGSFQSRVGASFGIQGWLWASAGADANFLRTVSTASFSYDTRLLTAFSAGPGAYVSSDSGALYAAAPVPEPQTYALMAMGLALVAATRLRGKQGRFA